MKLSCQPLICPFKFPTIFGNKVWTQNKKKKDLRFYEDLDFHSTSHSSIIPWLLRYLFLHYFVNSKITRSSDDFVVCILNLSHSYISICRRPVDTRWGLTVTYCERLPPLKLHDLTLATCLKDLYNFMG